VLPSALVGIVDGNREVTSEEAKAFAIEYNTFYYEVDLKTGKNVEDAVCSVVNQAIHFIESLSKETKKSEKSCVIN